jgi:hypothetical protein
MMRKSSTLFCRAPQSCRQERRRPKPEATAHKTKFHRIGQALADQLGDGVVLVDVAGSEIAGHGIADVGEVLVPERLVEMVGGHQVRHRLRRQRTFEIEGAARSEPHQEKGNRDDDKQRRHGARKAAQDKGDHGFTL